MMNGNNYTYTSESTQSAVEVHKEIITIHRNLEGYAVMDELSLMILFFFFPLVFWKGDLTARQNKGDGGDQMTDHEY